MKRKKRTYPLPKAKIATPEKMDAQLERLKERKLVSRKLRTLVGYTLTKTWRGKVYTLKATESGWFRTDTKEYYTSLYGAACSIVNGPRSGYVFFKDSLRKVEAN